MVMVNLGSTDDSRYTGYREITDRDVLDLQCILISILGWASKLSELTGNEKQIWLTYEEN